MICLPVPGRQSRGIWESLPALCLTDRTDPNRPAARRTSPGYNVVDGGLDVRCRVAPEPSNQERRAFGDRLYQEPAVVSISAAGGARAFLRSRRPDRPGSRLQGHPAYLPMQDRFHYVDVGLVSVRREEIVGRLDDPVEGIWDMTCA